MERLARGLGAAATFPSAKERTSLVGQIQVAQTDIAASVEHQAAVLSEVARQTATAAEAAGEINAGLNHLLAQS